MKRKVFGMLIASVLLVSFGFVVPASANGSNPIVNGSFETGDYTGWTLSEDSGNPDYGTWGIAQDGDVINYDDYTYDFCDGVLVQQGSPGLPITYSTTDGNHLAYQLQNGPETHRLYQDITLSPSATTLTWDMWYTNYIGLFDPGAQYLAVNIRDPSDDSIMEMLFKTTEGEDPEDISMTSFSRDISAYAGTTVRLDIEIAAQGYHLDAAFDNFSVGGGSTTIGIDIKPGSFPNSINLRSKGVVPVAILTTPDFDASTVDPETVELAGAAPVKWHLVDVSGDGRADLLLHFETQQLQLTSASTEATLTGKTFGGTPIQGTDYVRIVKGSK